MDVLVDRVGTNWLWEDAILYTDANITQSRWKSGLPCFAHAPNLRIVTLGTNHGPFRPLFEHQPQTHNVHLLLMPQDTTTTSNVRVNLALVYLGESQTWDIDSVDTTYLILSNSDPRTGKSENQAGCLIYYLKEKE